MGDGITLLEKANKELHDVVDILKKRNEDLQKIANDCIEKDRKIKELNDRIKTLETQFLEDTQGIRDEATRQMNAKDATHKSEVAKNIEVITQVTNNLRDVIKERKKFQFQTCLKFLWVPCLNTNCTGVPFSKF